MISKLKFLKIIMNILADASLPLLIQAFPPPFQIHYYEQLADLPMLLPQADILLCRSTLKVNADLLDDHHLKAVATASSGVDHIDIDYLAQQNIMLFDAKGSNAQAVADYVVSCLASLKEQEITLGIKIGIIGIGCVGSLVAHSLEELGFSLCLYDPPRALRDTQFISAAKEALYDCDVICVHANYTSTGAFATANLIDDEFLSALKPGTVILNAARGGIVNEQAVLAHNDLIYCTDVYWQEPVLNPEIVAYAQICTPHIAGHSVEAKLNAVVMLSEKIHQYFGLKFDVEAFKPAELCPIKDLPWDDHALAHYDPKMETEYLKVAVDKTAAFVVLRKAHSERHEFRHL